MYKVILAIVLSFGTIVFSTKSYAKPTHTHNKNTVRIITETTNSYFINDDSNASYFTNEMVSISAISFLGEIPSSSINKSTLLHF